MVRRMALGVARRARDRRAGLDGCGDRAARSRARHSRRPHRRRPRRRPADLSARSRRRCITFPRMVSRCLACSERSRLPTRSTNRHDGSWKPQIARRSRLRTHRRCPPAHRFARSSSASGAKRSSIWAATFERNIPAARSTRLFTIYSIVNALTVNLPAITRVQILIDGKEADTLAGHVDLRHPLQKNLKWTELQTDNDK